jgi:hypothetical protein
MSTSTSGLGGMTRQAHSIAAILVLSNFGAGSTQFAHPIGVALTPLAFYLPCVSQSTDKRKSITFITGDALR